MLPKKVKQPHFTSITRDSNSTDKLEVDGALILTPSSHQCSVLRAFKSSPPKLQEGERSWTKDVMSPGFKLKTSRTEGRALTNCATLARYCEGNKRSSTFQVPLTTFYFFLKNDDPFSLMTSTRGTVFKMVWIKAKSITVGKWARAKTGFFNLYSLTGVFFCPGGGGGG